MGISVSMTDLRPQLTKLLGQVEFGDAHVKVTRHGKVVAVIVPPMEFQRMFEAMEDEVAGPRGADGRRRGNALILLGDKLGIARRKKLERPPPEGRARNWWWHW